jgi:hypothetical protein
MTIPFPAEYEVSRILLQLKREHVKIPEDLQLQQEPGKLFLPPDVHIAEFRRLSPLAFSQVYFLSPRIVLLDSEANC